MVAPQEVSEELYYKIKAKQEQYPYLAGFVGFGCSFSGIWFSGYAKDNTGRNYCNNAHNSILKKINKLQNVEFINKDFSELNFNNALIYCDPPYRGTTPYNKSLLGDFPYDEFLKWVKEQSKNNIVLVSEYKHNTPNDAVIVFEINSHQEIRGKNGRKPTIEVLYTYNKELINYKNE